MNKLDVLAQHLGIHKQMAGNNLYFHCPSCQHHNNKLTVNLDKSVYNCWHCGLKGRSFVYLLRLAGAIKPNQYRNLFEEDKKNSDISYCCDSSRFSGKYSWRPRVSLSKGIEQTLSYYRGRKIT